MNEYVFILCTHGRFGEELIKSAEMIIGQLTNVVAVSLNHSVSPEQYRGLLEKEFEKLDGRIGICLTDLFAGTPCTCAMQLSQDYDIEVLTGLNLAMLLEMHSQSNNLQRNELVSCGLQTLKESGKDVVSLMKGV